MASQASKMTLLFGQHPSVVPSFVVWQGKIYSAGFRVTVRVMVRFESCCQSHCSKNFTQCVRLHYIVPFPELNKKLS